MYGVGHARDFGFTDLTRQELLVTTDTDWLTTHKAYIPHDYLPTDPRTQKIYPSGQLDAAGKRAAFLVHAKNMLRFSCSPDAADEALANKLADAWIEKKGVVYRKSRFS